jgi:hypothetical protein
VVLDTAIGKLHRERGREWAVIWAGERCTYMNNRYPLAATHSSDGGVRGQQV